MGGAGGVGGGEVGVEGRGLGLWGAAGRTTGTAVLPTVCGGRLAARRDGRVSWLMKATSCASGCQRRPRTGRVRSASGRPAAPGSGPIDLFAEGPTPEWALPVPEPADGAGVGLQRFVFELDGLPPGASADGATLTLTLVSGAGAIEVAAHLD